MHSRRSWRHSGVWCVTSMAHYTDVIMGTIASQITSLTIVFSSVYSGADQRKRQNSASLAFVRGIHRGPVNSPHKGPVTRKMLLTIALGGSHVYVCIGCWQQIIKRYIAFSQTNNRHSAWIAYTVNVTYYKGEVTMSQPNNIYALHIFFFPVLHINVPALSGRLEYHTYNLLMAAPDSLTAVPAKFLTWPLTISVYHVAPTIHYCQQCIIHMVTTKRHRRPQKPPDPNIDRQFSPPSMKRKNVAIKFSVDLSVIPHHGTFVVVTNICL